MNECSKKIKRLFAIWKVLFGVFSLGTSIYMGYLQGVLEMDVVAMPSVFQLILVAIIMFIFIPFLVWIRKRALLHNISDISMKSAKLLLALGVASVGTLICNLLSFLGLF